jgi:hypothetical protein
MNATNRFAPGVLSLVLAVSVASCGGGGGGGGPSSTPPSISDLSFAPTSVPQSDGGTATVDGSVQFTDSGGDLATFNMTVTDSSGHQVASISDPLKGAAGGTSGTIQGEFQVSTSTTGVFTFSVWVVDAAGARSNTLASTFQVVPVSSKAAAVASTGTAPAYLTAMGGQLYWTETGDAVVKAVSAAGGTPTVLAYQVHNPAAMAFAGTDVIWVDDLGPSQGPWDPSTVGRALKRTSASGVTTVLDTAPACDSNGATDLVVAGDAAYWVTCTTGPSDYAIRQSSLSGGGFLLNIYAASMPISALSGAPGLLVWSTAAFGSSSALTVYSTSSTATTTFSVPWMDDVFAFDATNVYYATANKPPFTFSGTSDLCTLWAQPLAGGAPVVVAASIVRPIRLAAAGGKVVWVDAAGVNSMASGGGPVAQLASVTNTPLDLLLSGTDVVWTETTGPQHGETGAIHSVPLAGGTTTTLYQGGDAPRRLALDASAGVNWTEGGSVGLVEGFGRIARLSAGNVVETVVAGLASDSPPLVASGLNLYVADLWRIKSIPSGGGMPETVAADDAAISALTTDGSSVYWTSGADASVRKAAAAGGPVIVLVGSSSAQSGAAIGISTGGLTWVAGTAVEMIPAPAPNSAPVLLWNQGSNVSTLAVDATHAYFGVPSTNDVFAIPLAGGSTQSLAKARATAAVPLLGITRDGTTLYWIDAAGISKVPAGGGAALGVVDFDTAGTDATSTMAVDTTNVYWTEPVTKQIRSAPK